MRDSVAVKHSAEPISAEDIVRSFIQSIDTAKRSEQPYRHWTLAACLPSDAVDEILALPFDPPSLDGVSGKRELHNTPSSEGGSKGSARMSSTASEGRQAASVQWR